MADRPERRRSRGAGGHPPRPGPRARLLVSARRRVNEAEKIATERGREAAAISRLSTALSSAQTGEDAAVSLFDEVEALLGPDALLLARVDEELRTATSVSPREASTRHGGEASSSISTTRQGAIVSVVRERSPLAIYDAVTAANVNRALADAIGAKSAAFVRCSRRATSSASSSR